MTDTEINEVVAKKLGYRRATKYEDVWEKAWVLESPDKTPGIIYQLPDYCHSIEAAWEIVEKMKHFCLDKDPDGWSVWDMAGTEEAERICKASTAPMAICKAFLKLK